VLVASETGFVYGPGQVETAGESAVVVTLV
jgi:hypothetical protein